MVVPLYIPGNEAGPCEHADDGASDRSVQEQECSAKESSTAPENTRTPQQPKSTKPLAILVPSSPRAGMGLTTNKSARKPSAPVARSFNLSQGAATPEPKMQTSGGVAGGAMSTPRSVLREMRRRERGAALRAACIAILLVSAHVATSHPARSLSATKRDCSKCLTAHPRGCTQLYLYVDVMLALC